MATFRHAIAEATNGLAVALSASHSVHTDSVFAVTTHESITRCTVQALCL